VQPIRPVCLTCVSFDVEDIVDDERDEVRLFACFACRDVYYFMADAQPRRRRRLGLFEVYESA
jgi:hypothetical protein